MASLPSPTQVAGSHYPIYEAYYQQVDPNNQGTIGALEAARFLKKSKLSDIVLGKIWDLSDPNQKGALNRQGFFVALKLCALAQAGRGTVMDNILADDVPCPKMGEIPKVLPNKVINSSQPKIDWSVKPAEKAKYDQLFDSLQPTNGVIPGAKVRNVLIDSKLPVDVLGKIWDLADLDKDGSLNRHEFMIAMHLVYKALEKHTIPNTLPPELMPASKKREPLITIPNLVISSKPAVPPQPSIPPLPNVPHQPSKPPLPPQPVVTPQITSQTFIPMQQPSGILQAAAPLPVTNWVVTPEEKAKADALFQQTDFDKDGFVSGFEIKDVFLQSGVPQRVLADIWSLCDTNQSGKLNNEQFALAMWLINQKVKGIDPPPALTPEMVPPSMRPGASQQAPQVEEAAPAVPAYTNPELELIAADIRELTREKNTLETEIAQKEADINIKKNEVKSLQSEVDTLAATLKQLENQKGEAQKRLNDLKAQKSTIEVELGDLSVEVEAEQAVVDKLRQQAAEQEESLRNQENELSSKKQELENLKKEEARLEKLQEESKKMLENLGQKLQDSQLQISQVKSKITQLEEIQRQMNDAIAVCESAIATNDASIVPDSSLSIGPDFRDPEITKLTTIVEEGVDNNFSDMNGTSAFNSDGFSNDAFSNVTADAFGQDDSFSSAFGAPAKANEAFGDPFSAFGVTTTNSFAKPDPFDPFGDGGGRMEAKTPVDMSDKDPFGCDPFANLHAPERPSNPPARPESPSPALPPKKSKQPPPRPAPPRPMQPNMRAAPAPPTPSPDSTSVTSKDLFSASGSFANFANFDNKLNKRDTQFTTGGLRSDSKSPAHGQSLSVSPVNVSTQNRYATFEFTEDPFKNYRYDDLFNIDPFEEDGTTQKEEKTNQLKFNEDDTAYETPIGKETFESTFPKIDAFDADFSFGSDPFASSSAEPDKMNGNPVSLFSNSKQGFSDNNANSLASDPFSRKNDEKSDSFFGSKKLDNADVTKSLPNEELQLVWAAEESLRLEEERLKQEAQEKAEYEYALALSKKDSKDKRTIKNLLKLGRSAPAT